MRKPCSQLLAGAAALAIAFSAVSAQAGMPVETDGPRLSFRAEALFLERDDPSGVPLVVDDDNSTGFVDGHVFIDADDFEFDRQEAGRFTFGIHEGSISIEGVYLKVDDHGDTVSQFFPDNDETPTTFLVSDDVDIEAVTQFGCCKDIDDPFEDINFASLALESELQGFELNFRHRLPAMRQFHVSILAGFRWLSFEEDFELFTDDDLPIALPNSQGPGGQFTDRGLFGIQVDNDLYGLQLGGTVHRDFALNIGPIESTIRLGSKLKVGLMGNHAEQQTQLDSGGFLAFDDQENSKEFATIVETGFLIEWTMDAGFGDFSILTGYDALHIDGIALSTDHLKPITLNGFSELNTTGSILYHGPYIGARYTMQFTSLSDLLPDNIFP